MRVMHVLHRSVPGTHGYAIRSREIVLSQLRHGLEPFVVTSPSQAPQGALDEEKSEVINGIRYFRTCSDILPSSVEVRDDSPLRSALRVVQNVALFKTALRVARKYHPAIIHAHSPFTCGMIGAAVGRRLGIPAIYEVRGLWEDSHVGRQDFSERSLRYKGVRLLDNLALKGSDACCVISQALAEEVRSRGIAGEKIVIVPNGVDVETFVPGDIPAELQSKLGLEDAVTIGYIGSFFHYEGLDLMVAAMTRLVAGFPKLRMLLVGDGELMPTLRDMAAVQSLQGRVLFTGRVPHKEIIDYYRLLDFFILPRRETRETRLVTPLKPMEIMAMAKPLIASDIGGHREMIEDRTNGVFFRSEDVDDLASKCRILLTDPQFRSDMGSRARKWVEANRDWNVLVSRYIDLYARLTTI